MDLDQLPFDDGDSAAAAAASPSPGRSICHAGCGRLSRVCLCPHLPSSPLPTTPNRSLPLSFPLLLNKGSVFILAQIIGSQENSNYISN